MKKTFLILFAIASIAATACNSKKADSENADSMYKYTDTNVRDSLKTDTTSDSTTNAPADANN